uniref:Protein RFT1 homolog n=1 Tax=Haemonchus placei TaxID=6290 RepID=A0A0N4WT11_HAEPC
LSAIGTLFAHSIVKQLMTDGSAYVMTFTELLSLKSQAVYDAVEKVGSLVARIVLAPLEEMCFAYFSNTVNQSSKVFSRNTVIPYSWKAVYLANSNSCVTIYVEHTSETTFIIHPENRLANLERSPLRLAIFPL